MTQKEIFDFAKTQREAMGANDARRDANLEIPSDVKCFFDIRYSEADEVCLLDVYKPKRATKKLLPHFDKEVSETNSDLQSARNCHANCKFPVIVSVHGGGWVYGDKKLYSFYCMELARRGFAVVNFTYRLSPEHKFPAALEDTNDVFKWILKNSSQYNLDAENIFATGDSAGANYLATYAAICTNENFAKNFNFEIPKKLKLNAVYLNCGMYDFVSLSKTLDTKATGGALFKKGGTRQELILASPIFHVEENFPPTFFVTAEEDFLREQVPPIAKIFCEKRIEFKYKCYRAESARSAKGRSKNSQKLGHVFMLDLHDKHSAPCLDEQREFFREHLRT